MRQVIVRYKVKPDRVAENEALARAVYEELDRTGPAGLHYATFRQPDGVSFVHISMTETGDGLATRSARSRRSPASRRRSASVATSRPW